MRTTDSKVAVIADEYPDTLTRCVANRRSASLTVGLAFAQLKDENSLCRLGSVTDQMKLCLHQVVPSGR